MVDVMPKVVVQTLLAPALHLRETVRIVCREAASDLLLGVATHELDVVLSDSPVDPSVKIRAYSHLLGECGVIFVGGGKAAARHRRKFPESLNGASMFLPTDNRALRRNQDFWIESNGIRPLVLGEFEDYALLRAFGETGPGVFPLPAIVEAQICRKKSLRTIGATDQVRTQFTPLAQNENCNIPRW